MKKFHHYLLKGLLLLALLPLLQSQSFARGETDSSIRLTEALKLIKNHYKVDILFEDKNVDGLTVPAGLINFDRTAEENMAALLDPFALNYKKVKSRSYLIIADRTKPHPKNPAAADVENPGGRSNNEVSADTGPAAMAARPDRWITGTVTSTDGLLPEGASVNIKGGNKGTTTDINGRFRLNVGEDDKVLLLAYTGYKKQAKPYRPPQHSGGTGHNVG